MKSSQYTSRTFTRVVQWAADSGSFSFILSYTHAQQHTLSDPPRAQDTHAYYRLYAYVRPEGLNVGWDRDRIVAEVTARGIPLFQGSCSEVYLEKAFSGTDLVPPERLPVARELGETSLMFLTHPTLTDSDLNRVCATLDEVMRDAAR